MVSDPAAYMQDGDHNNLKGDDILSRVSVLQLLCA